MVFPLARGRDPSSSGSPYLSRLLRNKEISYTRADGGTTMLRFHWNTIAWVDGLATYIESLPSPPTHVYYASHLWMTRRNSTPEHFVESVRPFLNKLIELVPKAKIVTRTTTSAVQQLVRLFLSRSRLSTTDLEVVRSRLEST